MDVGVTHLAVLSDGTQVANPRPLAAALGKLRRLNRQLARQQGPRAPDGTRRLPSAGWRDTQARLARLHGRVANLRGEALQQLTSRLAGTYGTVVVERLNLAGMVANRRLARAITDSGMGQVRRLLGYKTLWAGGRLVEAGRFYPSSKACSACGAVKAKLPLGERVYCCERCGLAVDRDVNAARNLAGLVAEVGELEQQVVARSGRETRNARGPGVRPDLAGLAGLKREAGTSRALGETGTVGPQGPAARHVTLTEPC